MTVLPTCRQEDLDLLDALLADDVELRESERIAFEDMRERLDDQRLVLTQPQREWLTDVAKRLDVSTLTPAERNVTVPRGREVAPPPALSRESLQRALSARRRR